MARDFVRSAEEVLFAQCHYQRAVKCLNEEASRTFEGIMIFLIHSVTSSSLENNENHWNSL